MIERENNDTERKGFRLHPHNETHNTRDTEIIKSISHRILVKQFRKEGLIQEEGHVSKQQQPHTKCRCVRFKTILSISSIERLMMNLDHSYLSWPAFLKREGEKEERKTMTMKRILV
jgi:hypothetical protein